MFMPERGVEVPRVEVDLRGSENRQGPFMAKNPAERMPCLELGDGTVLADILLFCFLDFGNKVGQPIDPALGNIAAHHARMAARPSAKA